MRRHVAVDGLFQIKAALIALLIWLSVTARGRPIAYF